MEIIFGDFQSALAQATARMNLRHAERKKPDADELALRDRIQTKLKNMPNQSMVTVTEIIAHRRRGRPTRRHRGRFPGDENVLCPHAAMAAQVDTFVRFIRLCTQVCASHWR